MKYFLFLALFAGLFSQAKVDLGDAPSHSGKVKLKQKFKFVDDEGFYDATMVSIAKNGTIFLYDVGNKTMLRYNKDGKREHAFGEEGNGPGEFNQFVGGIVAGDDMLIVRAGNKLQLFDYDGKLIREIVDFGLARSLIEFKKDEIWFHTAPVKVAKVRVTIYDKKGIKLREVANTEFDQAELDQMMQSRGGPPGDKQVKMMLSMPNSMIFYNEGFLIGYGGEYNFNFIDKNHKVVKTYSRNYDREKIVNLMDILPRQQRRMYESNKNNEQFKKIFTQVTTNFKDRMGGYFPDIYGVLGAHNGYVFVRTSAESIHTVNIDVISPDEKLYDKITLNTGDNLNSVTFEQGKLIANYSNDEEGPYALVYDVEFN